MYYIKTMITLVHRMVAGQCAGKASREMTFGQVVLKILVMQPVS